MLIAAEYAGHWKVLPSPLMTAAIYKCQISNAPNICKTRIPAVARIAVRSLTIIINLRLCRSTITPAMGESKRKGTTNAVLMIPREVALPVS